MVQPSPTWNTVPVYGTWKNFDGSLRQGTYEISIPVRVTNGPDNAIFPAGIVASGDLQTVNVSLPSMRVDVPASNDADNDVQNFTIKVSVRPKGAAEENYYLIISLASNDLTPPGINLRTAVLQPSAAVPVMDPILIKNIPNGIAGLDSSGLIPLTLLPPGIGSGGGGTNLTNYSQISGLTGYPATFKPTIGTTAITAVAGNDSRLSDARAPLAHTHVASQISDATPTGRGLMTATDAAAARTLLQVGTGNLVIGTTSTTAKAGNWTPSLIDMPQGYNYRGAYSVAAGQPTRAAYLTAIGAPNRFDFSITLYGQLDTQADITWLLDGPDISEIGPVAA